MVDVYNPMSSKWELPRHFGRESPPFRFHKSKDASVAQKCLSKPDVSQLRLGTHFCQEFRAYLVFHDVHSTGCSELLVVLLFGRD